MRPELLASAGTSFTDYRNHRLTRINAEFFVLIGIMVLSYGYFEK